MSDACEMDVFVPNFRRGPEFGMNDILWDVALSYRWFISQLKQQDQNGTCNSKVFLYGCSSGAGLCLRLVQFIAELQRGEELLPPYISVALQGVVTMPVGVALTSPFVDYSMERCSLGSFVQYGKHDLLVHEGVQEIGLSVADKVMGGMSDAHSPLSHSMQGLPPLCVVFSEHEVTYDETVVLVNLARKENVRVTVGLWKFMCHAWCFFGAFIPEGRQAMDFVRDWYMDQKQVQSTSSIRAS